MTVLQPGGRQKVAHGVSRGFRCNRLRQPGGRHFGETGICARRASPFGLKGERQEITYPPVGWTPRPSGKVRTDEASILRGEFHLPLA